MIETKTDILDFDAKAERAKLEEIERKKKRERDNADMCKILAMPEGRRVIHRIIGMCQFYQSSMTGNSYTFFNEGMREAGRKIITAVVEAKPEAYLQMQQEHISELISQNKQKEKRNDS